jgi:pentatricopeptide repeat protein
MSISNINLLNSIMMSYKNQSKSDTHTNNHGMSDYMTLVSNLSILEEYDLVFTVINYIFSMGMSLDTLFIKDLLWQMAKFGLKDLVQNLLNWMESHSLQLVSSDWNALVYAYCVNGQVDEALSLLDNQTSITSKFPNFTSYHIIIDYLLSIHDSEDVLHTFDRMLTSKKIQPTGLTYLRLLKSLQPPYNITIICEIVRLMDKCPVSNEFLPSYTLVIKYLAEANDILGARCLFDRILERGYKPDTALFNTLISAYKFHGMEEQSYQVYLDMKMSGVKPDSFTFSDLLSLKSYRGDAHVVQALLLEMKEMGVEVDETLNKAVIFNAKISHTNLLVVDKNLNLTKTE